MDLLAAYIDAELAGEDKPSDETIREIVENHGGTIDANNPNVILTPDGEIRLDGVLNDASSGTDNPEEINKTIIELNKQINDLKGQLATANADKENLQSQVTELNASITELNTQVASWKKKAEDGEVTISEKDTQISNLNSQITSKNQEIEEKQNKIQELEGNVTTLTNEKQNLETQVATLNARVAELEGKQATGDATASDVLEGKTFSTAEGVNLTGTMVNRGTLNFNPAEGISQIVEPGYYSGGMISSETAYKNGCDATRLRQENFQGPFAGTQVTINDTEFYAYDCDIQEKFNYIHYILLFFDKGMEYNDWWNISSSPSDTYTNEILKDRKYLEIKNGHITAISTMSTIWGFIAFGW